MTAILKVDTIQDVDGNNIINENSNTITIGASGDTINVPSGATFNINGTAGTGVGTAGLTSSGGNITITDGNLIVASGHGIDFSATGDATGSTQELLDDYEEGTWSPAIDGSTITTGYYAKVGRICIAQFGDATNNVPELTNGSNFTITGLPFSQLASGWTYGSTPSVSYADASQSYHSYPLTGRQRNDGAIHVANRSGQTKVSGDPVNLCIVYQTN